MELIVRDRPERVLGEAVAFLVSEGYAVDNRDSTSATLSRTPPLSFSFWESCLIVVLAAASAGFLLVIGLLIIAAGLWKWRATVLVSEAEREDGTRLVLGGSNPKVQELLDGWAENRYAEARS